MRFGEFLTEVRVHEVLAGMAATIDPSRAARVAYSAFGNQSCYGSVAHHLMKHQDPSWYILFFGNPGTKDVTHTCLYTQDGQKVVDTFGGSPTTGEDGDYVYLDHEGHEHQLIYSVTVGEFMDRFFAK